MEVHEGKKEKILVTTCY